MIILLFGEDTYRSKQKLKEVISSYKESQQGEVSLEDFEVADINYRDFKDQFRQASMFADKKLTVLRGVFEEEEFKEKFLEDAEQWEQSNDIIVLFEEKITKSDSLFKFIKKNSEWEQFELLEGKELKDWASQQFDGLGVEIDSKALSTLVDFVGSDLWRFSNEIQKLANYKKGEEKDRQSQSSSNSSRPPQAQKKKVEVEDVELLVKPDLETDIFNTIDAFAFKNNQKSLNLIQEHLDQGDSPLYILSMINYQLRNLLSVKQLNQQGKSFSDIKQKTDLHPYVIKKSLKQCSKFGLREIKKIYHQLLEVDLDIKTGKVDKEPALKSFIAEV